MGGATEVIPRDVGAPARDLESRLRTILRAVRVAVVDLGTNSSRLLIADIAGDTLVEVDRRTTVTRLGDGLERTGELSTEAIARVETVLDEYAQAIAASGASANVGVLTSAARDARNGDELVARVRARGIDAHVLDGDQEARLTYLGATAGLPNDDRRMLVIDIGGGSTELVVGRGGDVESHVSLQLGVVRHSERHLHSDPPTHHELEALADDVRATLDAGLPDAARARRAGRDRRGRDADLVRGDRPGARALRPGTRRGLRARPRRARDAARVARRAAARRGGARCAACTPTARRRSSRASRSSSRRCARPA